MGTLGAGGAAVQQAQRQAHGDAFRVLCVRDTGERELSQGTRSGAVLTLNPPVDGIRRLFLCRFGAAEMLVPDQGCWFEASDPSTPRGVVFTRLEAVHLESLDHLKGYLPGPEDENKPTPWREVYGTGG